MDKIARFNGFETQHRQLFELDRIPPEHRPGIEAALLSHANQIVEVSARPNLSVDDVFRQSAIGYMDSFRFRILPESLKNLPLLEKAVKETRFDVDAWIDEASAVSRAMSGHKSIAAKERVKEAYYAAHMKLWRLFVAALKLGAEPADLR